MATIPGVRGRLARPDPMTLVSCAVAAVVYVLHGFDGPLSRDLGVYAYGGQQVAEGVPPYEAIVNRAGPLAHLIPGLGVVVARAVGVDDVRGMRVLFLLISVACVGLAYLLGRDQFRSRPAGVATAAALLTFEGFIEYATNGPREKTAMVLFVLCALLAVLHRRWATTGFFIALATLTWQPVFPATIAAAAVAVLVGVPQGRLRALVRLAVGGLVPAAVTVATYALVSDVHLLLDDFLLINARYTTQVSVLRDPGTGWALLVRGYGLSTWVLGLGAVSVVVLAGRAMVGRGRRGDPRAASLAGLGVMVVVGLLWSLKAFNSWPDLFFLLPATAVGVGGVAAGAAARVSPRALWTGSVAWALAATALAAAYSVGTRDDGLDDQRESVAAVMSALPPGARMLSVEAPQALVLAHQRNISRLQLFGNGLVGYVDDTWPGGIEGYAAWVERRAPSMIARGQGTRAWLDPVLERSYRRIGQAPGWAWYARKDLGRSRLQRMHDALRAQSWRVEG